MTIGVGGVLAAAGQGRRFGGDIPKTLHHLRNKPLFVWALEPLAAICDRVVVAAPESHLQAYSDAVNVAGMVGKVTVTVGAQERWQSVLAALDTLGKATMVIVHDGARPLASADLFEGVLEAARNFGAATCGVPITSPVKEVDAEGRVVRSPSRERLWVAQTPQAFYGALLRDSLDALAGGNLIRTDVEDDAAIVAEAGGLVQLVTGHSDNRAITKPADLSLAEFLSKRREAGGG